MKGPSSYLRQVWCELSIMDKLLPIFILICIIIGIIVSHYVPSSRNAIDGAQVLNTPIPLAVGMIVMMVPPLCKVEWENIFMLVQTHYFPNIVISIIINWIICPLFMFGLAWLTLFDKPEYREGIIMIGLARCIAMVLVWNEVSKGDNSLCAVLVLVNSTMQIVLYAPYQIFLCYVITGDYPAHYNASQSYSTVAQSVAFFLGIPVGLGLIIRSCSLMTVGKQKYENYIIPVVSPFALLGLLFTIIMIFISKGDSFLKEIGTSIRCFVPLLIYFPVTFITTFFFMRWIGSTYELQDFNESKRLVCECKDEKQMYPEKWAFNCSASYRQTITQCFTAASNNFELSIAISISLYGNGSRQAIASVYGPLLEIPIMLLLCFAARYLRVKCIWKDVKSQY